MPATQAKRSGSGSRGKTTRNRKESPAQRSASQSRGAAASTEAASREEASTGRRGRKPMARKAASKPSVAAKSIDALQLLKQDHREVEELFSEFESAKDGRTRSSVARRIAQALTVHAQIEEELFYPAVRQELQEHSLINEAKVEHESVKRLIADLEDMKPSDELYKAKMTVLREYVKHHVKEEERELFPMVKKSELDLMGLGEELMARKTELMGRGGQPRGRRKAERPAEQVRT